MHLVEHFAKESQPRTAVFNINNAEEDGLKGAHVFLQQPWFKIFLNLEGATAGGRPTLFRSTSAAATLSFKNGLIRSRTDFSVYQGLGNGTGLDGLDFAFYQGRSKYHTKCDSMPGPNGAKKSL